MQNNVLDFYVIQNQPQPGSFVLVKISLACVLINFIYLVAKTISVFLLALSKDIEGIANNWSAPLIARIV